MSSSRRHSGRLVGFVALALPLALLSACAPGEATGQLTRGPLNAWVTMISQGYLPSSFTIGAMAIDGEGKFFALPDIEPDESGHDLRITDDGRYGVINGSEFGDREIAGAELVNFGSGESFDVSPWLNALGPVGDECSPLTGSTVEYGYSWLAAPRSEFVSVGDTDEPGSAYHYHQMPGGERTSISVPDPVVCERLVAVADDRSLLVETSESLAIRDPSDGSVVVRLDGLSGFASTSSRFVADDRSAVVLRDGKLIVMDASGRTTTRALAELPPTYRTVIAVDTDDIVLLAANDTRYEVYRLPLGGDAAPEKNCAGEWIAGWEEFLTVGISTDSVNDMLDSTRTCDLIDRVTEKYGY